MHLPRSRQIAPELIWFDEVGSTNAALRDALVEQPSLPDRTVVVTENQTAGRGRLGREWVAPPGGALAVSIAVRKPLAHLAPSWLPLIAGSAVRRSLTRVLAERGGMQVALGVKWPNDVLATLPDGSTRKVSGILSELLADGSVIVGIGINTNLAEDQLPTPNATSLRLLHPASSQIESDTVLAALLEEFFGLLNRVAAGEASAIRERITADSSTLGTSVRAHLPSGEILEGVAVRLSDEGALVIQTSGNNPAEVGEVVVAAGDIQHLR